MSMIERTETIREPGGRLGANEEELFVARAARATSSTANAVITLGLAKGWKFRSGLGSEVAIWLPGAGEKAVTYTLRNVELWRALKNRGL